MPDQILIIIAVILFIVVGLMAKNRKAASLEGFSTKRNKLSWFVTTAGVSMTFVGGAALLNMSSLGYRYSWYTLIDPVAFMTGILIAVFFVRDYRNDTGITISQLLSGNNKTLSLYIGILTSVVFLLVIAAQFVAISKLLLPYFPGVNPILLMVIPSIIILLYVFAGGFTAVTNTDVLQLFFIFIFLLVPVGYFLTHQPHVPAEITGKLSIDPMPTDLIIYFGIFALFVPVSQDINNRAKSARNEKHARIGIFCGGLIYCLTVIACSFIGITLAKHGIKTDDVEQTFPTFFRHFFPGFGILAVLAGLAAIWSTLDTYLVNGITSVAQDILKKNQYFKNLREKRLILIAGILIFSVALFISIYTNEVLRLILTALLIYISVLIPIAIGKKLKIRDNIIFFVSVLTVIAIILCEMLKIELTPKAGIYPSCAIVLMLGGKLYQTLSAKR